MSIRSILARDNGDSLGISNLQVDLQTDLGLFRALLPPGGSTDTAEGDDELKKQNQRDYVSQEIGIINKIIAPELLKSGLEVIQHTEIDDFMVNLFGDIIGSKTVCNAILGVSLAVAMAGAVEKGIPLRKHIAHLANNKEIILPIPAFSVVSVGSHAGNKLVMEEFVILPAGVPSLTYAIGMDREIYDQLKKLIKEKFRVDAMIIGNISTMFVIVNNKECSDHIKTALKKAGHTGKIDIESEFSEEGQYVSSFSHSEKSFLYQQFSKQFPMVSFEQSFNLDDWAAHISSTTTARIQIEDDRLIDNNPKAIKTETDSHSLKYKEDVVLQSNMDIRSEIDRLLPNKGANVNFQLESEYTTLHAAAKHGYAQLVEVLLEFNANVNSRAAQNSTPLHLSAAARHAEICMMLLKKGADVNAKNEDGQTPLHLSAADSLADICRMLLNNGADVNAESEDGETPLHLAAENGRAETCRVLLNKGADVNAKSEFDRTPLHLSANEGLAEICMMLLNNGADVNAKNHYGETPLHRSADKGHAETCSVLLNKGADVNAESEDGETPLHLAAENGRVETCRVLLNNGADVNAKTEYGITPLHVSAIEGQAEICMMLLDNGADVNTKDPLGQTPLYLAAELGRENTVSTILKFDPDINTTDSHGRTPLHIASDNGHRDVVKILLEYGCDINNMGRCNKTPLELAMPRFDYTGDIDIVEDILGHIVKMKTAKLYVSEENLESLRSWQDKYNVYYNLQNECKEEIARMKKEKISNTNASFYDILTKGSSTLAAYMKNENIVQVLQSDVYKTKFPIYSSMIASQFRKGMKRV